MAHDITLNIHYTIPNSLWNELKPFILELNENGIEYSVEPGGLQLYPKTDTTIPQKDWENLIDGFCKKATEILGYPVGDACGGFPHMPYER